MRKIKKTSLFSFMFIVLFNIYFKNMYLILISLSFFLLTNKKLFLLSVLTLLLFITTSLYFSNLKTSYGIVEDKYNNYSIVNNGIYKIKLNNIDNKIGDVVEVNDLILITDNKLLIKNYKYEATNSKYLFNLKTREFIYNRINQLDEISKNLSIKLFYNNYSDNDINIGNGYVVYFLIKYLIKKNKVLGLIVFVISILLFNFQNCYLLLIIETILNLTNLDKVNKLSIEIIVISIINVCLLLNYSILVPILISILNILDISTFESNMAIVSSFLFGSIDIFKLKYFDFYCLIRCLLLFVCVLTIVFPRIGIILYYLALIIEFIMNVMEEFAIRGSISLITLLLFVYIKNKYVEYKKLQFYILIFLMLFPLSNILPKVSFIDVGQGDSILIRDFLGFNNILIDTGSEYNYSKLKTFLFKEGIYAIDYLIITHDDSDHNGNIDNLKKDFIVFNYISTGQDIKTRNIDLRYLYIDDFDNDNDNSLVYFLNHYDINYLLTGDISKNAEKLLTLKYNLNDIDIIKVSHHGSKTGTSSRLISSTLPKIGIISTSGAYNHPSEETLKTLHSYLVKSLITKTEGSISIYNFLGLKLLKTDSFKFVIIN